MVRVCLYLPMHVGSTNAKALRGGVLVHLIADNSGLDSLIPEFKCIHNTFYVSS